MGDVALVKPPSFTQVPRNTANWLSRALAPSLFSSKSSWAAMALAQNSS